MTLVVSARLDRRPCPRPSPHDRSGAKKILAVGAAFDVQQDFHGYDADVFFDHPLGPGALTAQFDYNRYDGGDALPTLPKQNAVLIEAGYLIRALKLTPVLQIAHRDLTDQSQGDETRVAAGANYWWAGHNANRQGSVHTHCPIRARHTERVHGPIAGVSLLKREQRWRRLRCLRKGPGSGTPFAQPDRRTQRCS
jgi:hypothetical protein